MELLVNDLTLSVVNPKAKNDDIVAQIRGCDRIFFTKWLERVYASKPWETRKGLRKVVRYGFLVKDGEGFSSPSKKEVQIYPRLFNPKDGLVAFSVVSSSR